MKEGLYDSSFEHDACGIGAIINKKGIKSHELISKALDILIHLEHRGGTGAESNSGDGAGILFQIPDEFFKNQSLGFTLPDAGNYAVGQLFLSKNETYYKESIEILEEMMKLTSLEIIGYRDVPYNPYGVGESALSVMPKIVQVFIRKPEESSPISFEKNLYLARRRVENKITSLGIPDFYICSLSSKTIVYKGMLVSTQVGHFYVDLMDNTLKSSLAMVHSRFSTNTFPSWSKAHPYRMLCHNGEINTIKGNVGSVKAREGLLKSSYYKENLKDIMPIIANPSSDSAMVDNFVEFLHLNGRSIEEIMMMLVPEPWHNNEAMDPQKKAFYEYHATFMEPWDGPSAFIFTDGDKLGAMLDRNGLRPLRYCETVDSNVILYSETGSVEIPEEMILYKSRLTPGGIILVDTNKHKFLKNDEVKLACSKKRPYLEYVKEISHLKKDYSKTFNYDATKYNDLLKTYKVSQEEINNGLIYIANNDQEKLVAMGKDTPISVLKKSKDLLYDYFQQNFAQVTNPPIDCIREENVTSSVVFCGREGNILNPTKENSKRILLETPILSYAEYDEIKEDKNFKIKEFDITYENESLREALDDLFKKASDAIDKGCEIIILNDDKVLEGRHPMPALLVSAGLHAYLTKISKRTHASIILSSYEPREIHHFAVLLGYGVTAILPKISYTILYKKSLDKVLKVSYEEAVKNYIHSITKGIVKIASKMGISTIQSYNGAQIFEALGIGKDVIDEFFPGTCSAVDGISLNQIEKDSLSYETYKEDQLLDKNAIGLLQDSLFNSDYSKFKEFSTYTNFQIVNLRDLLKFKKGNPISVCDVEPVEDIIRRFSIAAMSYGAISEEAHEILATAMNELHAKSNSGEGGELSKRFNTITNSKIKQVASGRFGVTIEYLNSAEEIQIKVAQGAKPGEGGQLPAKKVYPWIADARHSTPGVSLISPPPHHDIYSIEDLAQLIYDLKNANPNALISVKLVSEAGVGTVSTGVIKAGANKITISGFDGGTGAAPRTSVPHCGMPFEIGLAEAHQTLMLNHLRDRCYIEADGKLLTGEDVVKAALLGADLFAFASAPLIAIGCKMLKVCNLNTCPFGVATQNDKLRKNFKGKVEYVKNYMTYVANEVREIMAYLGFKKMDDLIGHTEYLENTSKLDFSRVLHQVTNGSAKHFVNIHKLDYNHSLDKSILEPFAKDKIKKGEKVTIHVDIKNVNRAVGTNLSHFVVENKLSLETNQIEIYANGNAGNSLGAFLAHGIHIDVCGDANDYVGKGLSGGIISLHKNPKFNAKPEDNIISGNVMLYGATSGSLYADGIVGERFGVRLSGAEAVAISCGNHGAEYMTGGRILILDKVGMNFASGMSGGVCYIKKFNLSNVNKSINIEELSSPDINIIKEMLKNHIKYTNSSYAKNILANFNPCDFIKIIPRDYENMLDLIKKHKHDENPKLEAFNEAMSI